MESTEITIRTSTDVNFTDRINALTDPELKEIANRIAECVGDIHSYAYQIAIALGMALESKCYEKDGFKSVGDFAQDVFGINRSQAYRMASVASRFYLSDEYAGRNDVTTMPLNNLAELLTMSDAEIKSAFENGGLTPESKQADVRAYVQSKKPAKVLKGPLYAIKDKDGLSEGDPLPVVEKAVQMHFDKLFTNADGTIQSYTVVKCKPDSDKNITLFVVNRDTSDVKAVKLYYVKPADESARKSSKVKTTPGAAANDAIKRFMAEHDGKEPTAAELLDYLD